jgi:hypothetical protein
MVGKKWIEGKLVDNPNPEWAITESTRDSIRGYVERAIDEGWSPKHLADEIETSGIFSEDRAELVARTEIKNADNKGNMESYKATGLDLEKSWQVSADHPDDDECDENEAEGWIDINETFSSGDDSPGAHPRCMCTIEVRTKEQEE